MKELLEKIIINSKNTDSDFTSTRFSQEDTNTIFLDFYTNRKKYVSYFNLSQLYLPKYSGNLIKNVVNSKNYIITGKKTLASKPSISGSTSSNGLKSGLVFTPYVTASPVPTQIGSTIPSKHSYYNNSYPHSFIIYFIDDKDIFKGAYVNSNKDFEILVDYQDYLKWVLDYKLSKL